MSKSSHAGGGRGRGSGRGRRGAKRKALKALKARKALDGHDRRRLEAGLRRAADARTFRRVQAVLLVCDGRSVTEAARITRQTRQSVHNAVRRYLRSRRVADLGDAARSGRPRVASPVTDARVVREFGRDPLALGYMATEWTVPLLAGHLSRKYGCRVAPRTLRRRMKRLGLRWKRPRHAYGNRDPSGPQKKGRSTAG